MLKNMLSRKGQNMAEYAIIFGVVIAAAVGISALIKQGVQSRVVSEISKLGDTDETARTATFDINTYTGRTSNANESINVLTGGAVNERKASSGIVNMTENYSVGN
jgi:hypothetical protein